jgi:hypothetical protein
MFHTNSYHKKWVENAFQNINNKSNTCQFLKERNDESIITRKVNSKLYQTKKNIKTLVKFVVELAFSEVD